MKIQFWISLNKLMGLRCKLDLIVSQNKMEKVAHPSLIDIPPPVPENQSFG